MSQTTNYAKYRDNGTTKNPHLAYYLEAADFHGVKWEMISKTGARFDHNGKTWYIMSGETSLSSVTSKYISSNKSVAGKMFQMDGLPFPEFQVTLTADEAVEFYKKHKTIVVKPTKGDGGKGITILPENEQQVREAFVLAEEKTKVKGKDKVQVEEFIKGENYRLLVLEDKVIGAVHRKAAFVIGDGESTIKELIDTKNEQRVTDGLFKIPVDHTTELQLKFKEMDMNSIPEKDTEVAVRLNANLSTGGTTRECLKDFDPYYLELAIKAAKSMALTLAGVDLIAEDITDPKAGHVINEVNFHPGMRVHYMVDEGDVVPVARGIMKRMKI
jgi:D-alanine-D-alanine ligase-like ATP-grasp enzyme